MAKSDLEYNVVISTGSSIAYMYVYDNFIKHTCTFNKRSPKKIATWKTEFLCIKFTLFLENKAQINKNH